MRSYKKIICLFLILNSNIYLSISQSVDSLQNEEYAWQLDEAYQKIYIKIDTVLDNFQVFKDIENNSISNSTLSLVIPHLLHL